MTMPIRMERDPQQPQDQNPRQPGGGGGRSLLQLIPFLLLLLFKKPKLLIPVLLIGGAWYFFFGGKEMLNGGGTAYDDNETSDFQFGATLDQEHFDKAKVFEPIAYGYSGNQLPASTSLAKYIPRRLHQGQQGSCVGWASAYAARTILQARATGKDPNQVAFSPAYLYNQIALTGCEGAYMLDAMKSMAQNGGLPFQDFRYTDRTCSNYPSQTDIAKGREFKIKGFNRLTVGANDYKPDIWAIKQNLAQGAPVVIGMQVGGTFMSRMLGQKAWIPSERDYAMPNFGGHAMCVIGYDDNYQGGAFQLMNSWSEDWGDKGLAWVRYKDFEYFVKEAYGLYPMGSSDAPQSDPNKLAVEFGLLDIASQKTIPLKLQSDIVFRTTSPIRKGDKFKVLVANSIECYVYVFGQETDGSSYVLFPYTDKHSPYCGITGTRLFPKDYSMKADEIGNTDYIAVVVSKKELNFTDFNSRINSSRKSTYQDKLKDALAGQRIEQVTFQSGNTIAFQATSKDRSAVGMVIALDKR